ncbi:MAG TPA: Rieske (2Fe-2S) protein [Trebonia sp.]|nr:Rieske (2Fe-2S) protein [Trebonia sp.]
MSNPGGSPAPSTGSATWLTDGVRSLLRSDPLAALLPLRAFLAVTFCFAGLQKLANPRFFDAASPASIQSQMAAARRFSPISSLVGPLSHHAVLVGVLMALGEIAVGLGIASGVAARAAAAGGMVVAISLWLTVSWRSSPYYTGSDLVFAFAFTPFLIGGVGTLTLGALAARVSQRRHAPGQGTDPGRRRLLAAGLATGGLALSGLTAGIGRAVGGGRRHGAATPALGDRGGLPRPGPPSSAPATSAAAPSTSATASPASTTTAPPSTTTTPAGTVIGPASGVAVGAAASFTDPASGDPGVVLQPSPGRFLAFDAVCPHAGCTVGYSSPDRLLVCPCHGSVFDATTGDVLGGPAPHGLRRIDVTESAGRLYAR